MLPSPLETRPITDLRPDPANPRQISAHDFEALRRSLREYGAVEPAVILPDGLIVGGHQRIAAAEAEGWSAFPCLVVDLPLERARLLNLALNRIHGDWDDARLAALLADLAADAADLPLSGFSDEELQQILGGAVDPVPDDIAPPPDPDGGFGVLVACQDADHQQRVYTDLTGHGYACTLAPRAASVPARRGRRRPG